MTDQFECAFVTGFRDNLSYLCYPLLLKKKILKLPAFIKPDGIHIQV